MFSISTKKNERENMIKGKSALAKYIGCTRQTIENWDLARKLPQPDKLIAKGYSQQPCWKRETIDNFFPEKGGAGVGSGIRYKFKKTV